ncbi:site-specific integrase [Dietzia sp. B19]|uniref:tyrosine-type recombinase/integrase n=1 Tax=Dietzia sp. B19 TaxID=1630632 RepID=UPI0015F840B8|nr:site-specific integrase [Dietzia sp. B19]
MSIHKMTTPDGSVRWQVRWRTADNTQRKRSFKTKRDAAQHEASVTTALNRGEYVDTAASRGVTVDQLQERWHAQISGHLKATTLVSREWTYQTHIQPKWGGVPINRVQPSDLKAWIAALRKDGVGPATLAKVVLVLRQVLEVAVEDKQLASNPAAGLKAPTPDHVDKGYLTHQQLDRLAIEVGERHTTLVLFLGYCGLRWGEAAALRLSDFDALRARVNVSRSVAEVKGKQVFSTPKTGERRSVPVPRFLVERMARECEGKTRDQLIFGGGEVPVRISTWRPRVFNKAVARCRMADPEFPARLTPHSLRHTAASLAVQAGASVLVVSRLLGHSRPSVTLDVYAGLWDDDLQAVAGALDAERSRALAAP